MECLTELPFAHLGDQRPRKRARLGWDVAPSVPKVGLFTFFWRFNLAFDDIIFQIWYAFVDSFSSLFEDL